MYANQPTYELTTTSDYLNVSSSTSSSGVPRECSVVYGYISISLLAAMSVIGAVGNFFLLGCIYHRASKVPSDVIISALALLDLSFNLGLTPAIIWMNNYKNMLHGFAWSHEQIKYEGQSLFHHKNKLLLFTRNCFSLCLLFL